MTVSVLKNSTSKMTGKYIKLTKLAVMTMFDECNDLYFNGIVNKPKKFELWTPNKRCLGLSRPMVNKRTGKVTSALHISRRYKWTKQNLRLVVVHEMIHLLIGDYKEPLTFWQRLPIIGHLFITQHDLRFTKKMEEINATYGLQVKTRFREMRSEFKGCKICERGKFYMINGCP